MPAEDDYNRRQTLQHSTPASPSPASRPQYAATGCVAPLPADRYASDAHGERYAPERFANQSERFPPERNQSDRFATDRVQLEKFGMDRNQSERFAAERNGSDRFGSERSQSDRLPSGERYQGVSERYPLGERPQTSVSSDRLLANQATQAYQNDARYITYHRYPERYTPVGSLERSHINSDRYSRTITPTSMDRYNTLSTDKGRNTPERYLDRYHTISHEKDRSKSDRFTPTEQYKIHDKERKRCVSNSDRYIPIQGDVFRERQSSSPGVCSAERYSSTDRYKGEKRERSEDRKSKYQYQHDQYVADSFQNDRYPPIPCPERFASGDVIQYNETTYLEPPSPAPASDRFIPPPPLSPESSPTTPNCFSTSGFPSSATTTTNSDQFIPPPPLTTTTGVRETFSPNKTDRRYQYFTNDRYNQEHRYKDAHYGTDRFNEEGYHSHGDKYMSSERYDVGRYGPQNPHMPVERYVPQQQENYYGVQYDRYPIKPNANDPYMRRDLANFQYRLPFHLTQNQYQKVRYIGTPSRTKCCQYSEGYLISKSSPGSSSNSSVASQNKDPHGKEVTIPVPPCVNNVNVSLQDIQCQNFKTNYQQEKGTQCVGLCNNAKECVAFVSPNLRVTRGQCRHSICVSPSMEYVGGNGGRHVCATPPPRGSICSQDSSICNETCCARRGQTSLTVAIW
ncbi:hypothetical protein HHI36_015781 [Cryptolaemus montrouzieri]|uniref:Uncharacterized protein n=1 Tax=Cryptolaemus montrouzieri TaxID=559131 RepID=A0ABD2N6X3_9CUCU